MTKNRLSIIRHMADTVIILCLLAIAVFCIIKLAEIKRNYETSQKKYEEIIQEEIDFKALKKINPEVVGWIKCEGTVIDYPIVKGEDNEKYLTTMFDGSESDFGTLFVDCITKEPFKQFNTVIYGHHMKNGSMFASLKEWRDKTYAEKRPLVLYTPESDYDLMVWGFFNVPSNSEIYGTNLESYECSLYIQDIKDQAEYLIGEVTAEDRLVVLSTCAYEYDGARYVVVCKMKDRPRKRVMVEVKE